MLVAPVVLSALSACGSISNAKTSAQELGAPFVSRDQFAAARATGALVLDARASSDYAGGHIAGAVSAPWRAFVEGEKSGLLAPTRALELLLRERGVSAERAVLVYGAWDDAWGEEGRLFWMLEYLGHRDVRILEGGYGAWRAEGLPTDVDGVRPPQGDFVARPRAELRALVDDVKRAMDAGDAVILDTRTLPEYMGVTSFGEARGGHIPNAVHFAWSSVFDSQGALRAKHDLAAQLKQLGIGPDTQVIAYCTGGIRSGFLYAILRWLEHPHARNYDGSYWEWARRQELPVE
jgi:thiosulfate/3-mercaptopyruvate sulfurtransferase